MSVDRYTKAVLTVIAACLIWLSLGGPSLVVPVSAQNDRVYVAGWIDQDGSFRPLPRPAGQEKPATSGRTLSPTPLPIWQWNN
jgi:hypothetical protein